MQRSLWATLVMALILAGATWNWAADNVEPKAVIDKAIQAHGGEEKLAKLKVRQFKLKAKMSIPGVGEVQITGEMFQQLPKQTKSVMRLEAGGNKLNITEVINGDEGWISQNGQMRPLSEKEIAERKERLYRDYLETLLPLKGKDYELSALEEDEVAGKAAVGIKVSSKGHEDVKLYFDKASGLLVKVEYRATDQRTGEEVIRAAVFTNYKEFDGLKYPVKAILYEDGKQTMEAEITEVKFPEKLDESVFAKPE